MTKFNYLLSGALLLFVGFWIASCNDDNKFCIDGDNCFVLRHEAPTIAITSPADYTAGIAAEIGSVIEFTVNVEAQAGLSGIMLNDQVIQTYDGTPTQANFTYQYMVPNQSEVIELVFSVVDTESTSGKAISILITPIQGDTSLLIADLQGQANGATSWVKYLDWDRRIIFPFEVTGDVTTQATVEAIMQQAIPTFAADAPGSGKALQIVKDMPDSVRDQDYLGWSYLLFNLKNSLPESEVAALPHDNGAGGLTTGTRVVTLEVYYDATVDPTFGWNDLISQDAPWNAEPSRGYKIDLALLNYETVHAEYEDSRGYYVTYSKYIEEPNKWITLKFDEIDIERFAKSGNITPDQVTGFILRPASGYDRSKNKLYIRNLRIADND